MSERLVFSAADAARDALLARLERLQRAKAAVEAHEARALAALDAWRPAADATVRERWAGEQWIREEVACVLRVAPQTAAGRLARAVSLVTELPSTLVGLASGRLTGAHVRVVQDCALTLGGEHCAALEERVLAGCESTSVSQFRARCRRAVLAVDPDGAQRRHEAAKKGRQVRCRAGDNGMGDLLAHLDQASLARIEQRVKTLAERVAVMRTMDAASTSFAPMCLSTCCWATWALSTTSPPTIRRSRFR